MKAAIVGLPQSGKSTVFSAVTGKPIDPFAPREPTQAVVRVPDARLGFLTELCKPKKVVEATMEFIDIPGCALDDAKGQEEWRRRLPAVRQAELLVVVVRDFANAAVPSHQERIDPMADCSAVWDELIFADLDAVTTRLERLDKALKKPSKAHDQEKREQAVLLKCHAALEAGSPVSSVLETEAEQQALSGFSFLTERPTVCVRNVSDADIHDVQGLETPHMADSLAMSASIEAEIAALDPGDRDEFLAELGIERPARDRLIETCYRACGLISFLTMGPDEVRAWTIRKGSSAVEAAGKIHTDIARGFIRAETVAFDDLVASGDMKGARAAGKVRKEGKGYVVADGDILNILANT
jgi:hypothetical protein